MVEKELWEQEQTLQGKSRINKTRDMKSWEHNKEMAEAFAEKMILKLRKDFQEKN
jgi:hypothetical protein